MDLLRPAIDPRTTLLFSDKGTGDRRKRGKQCYVRIAGICR